jgi:hypothetical protein
VGTNFAEAKNDSNVEQNQAFIYAKKFLKENVLNGEDFSLAFGFNVYDIDDSILGYYLSYNQRNGNKGYIIIAANKERTPIIEFGEGDLGYSYKEALAEGNRIYYLGAINYLFAPNKEELLNYLEKIKNKQIENLEADLKNDKLNISKAEALSIKQSIEKEKLISMERGDYTELWSMLENDEDTLATNIGNSPYSEAKNMTTSKTLGVSRIWQRSSGIENPDSACGPASGAMVANYLNSQGYNVRNGSYYGGNAKFVNHLWDEMAWHFGATMGKYQTKMKTHLNLDYSRSKFNIVTWDTNDFKDYTRSIDEGFPVTIRFNNLVKGNYWSDWHFVVGGAYKTTSEGDFVGVKDPDGGSTNAAYVYFPWNPNYKVISLSKISTYY